jgi:hypothetical protein
VSRGYFTFAQYSKKFGDYPRMAYALALSLKASQTKGPSDLTVGMTEEDFEQLPKHYLDVLDVEIIPWTDEAVMHNWKLQNEWKVYHMTPYDETIKLDADMLFTTDVNYMWEAMAARAFPVAICDQVYTFRNHPADDEYYRKAFRHNRFYNAYSALTYFRKSHEAQAFYRQVEDVYHQWERYAHEFMRHRRNDVAYTDEVYGIAIKTLAWDNLVKPPASFGFVHLKSRCQGLLDWRIDDKDFTDYLDPQLTDTGDLFINNYLQTKPVHYTVKSYCDDELISKLEKLAGV